MIQIICQNVISKIQKKSINIGNIGFSCFIYLNFFQHSDLMDKM